MPRFRCPRCGSRESEGNMAGCANCGSTSPALPGPLSAATCLVVLASRKAVWRRRTRRAAWGAAFLHATAASVFLSCFASALVFLALQWHVVDDARVTIALLGVWTAILAGWSVTWFWIVDALRHELSKASIAAAIGATHMVLLSVLGFWTTPGDLAQVIATYLALSGLVASFIVLVPALALARIERADAPREAIITYNSCAGTQGNDLPVQGSRPRYQRKVVRILCQLLGLQILVAVAAGVLIFLGRHDPIGPGPPSAMAVLALPWSFFAMLGWAILLWAALTDQHWWPRAATGAAIVTIVLGGLSSAMLVGIPWLILGIALLGAVDRGPGTDSADPPELADQAPT